MKQKIALYLQNKPKQTAFICLGIILVAPFLLLVSRHLSTGMVVINTNGSSNNIEIQEPGGKQVTQAQGHLQIRLSPGQYVVQVNSRLAATKRLIKVEAHKT